MKNEQHCRLKTRLYLANGTYEARERYLTASDLHSLRHVDARRSTYMSKYFDDIYNGKTH
jgi:hypothetical protein